MKYNSEHYLIAQMYQAQERQDVNTDKNIKEFVEGFKSRFGSFIIEPGSFKLGYSDESNPSYMDVASVNLSTTDGNIKSGVVIFDRFAIGTSNNKVFANFIDENTKLYFEEAYFGESITIVKVSNQEDAGIYCCYASRDRFKNDYSLNVCYYDMETLNCLKSNYNLSDDEIVKLTKLSMLDLGMYPDKEGSVAFSDIKGYSRKGSSEELDMTQRQDFEYYIFNLITFDDLNRYLDEPTRTK